MWGSSFIGQLAFTKYRESRLGFSTDQRFWYWCVAFGTIIKPDLAIERRRQRGGGGLLRETLKALLGATFSAVKFTTDQSIDNPRKSSCPVSDLLPGQTVCVYLLNCNWVWKFNTTVIFAVSNDYCNSLYVSRTCCTLNWIRDDIVLQINLVNLHIDNGHLSKV